MPFRIQVDTFKQNENGEYTDHLHSASCQIKVFKPKGADRKQKTDREKMEKRTAHEKEKYQPSYDTTILTECSPWPDAPTAYVNNSPSPAPTFTSSQQSTCSVPDRYLVCVIMCLQLTNAYVPSFPHLSMFILYLKKILRGNSLYLSGRGQSLSFLCLPAFFTPSPLCLT